MRIAVSNFGKQYSTALLNTLEQEGWLSRFYTSFAANKLPESLSPYFRKRAFGTLPKQKIAHFPTLFFTERLLRNRLPGFSRFAGEVFDKKVAHALENEPSDLVLTYENTNRHTMRMAKSLGKITMLDLAQIHHEDIVRYGQWFLPPERLKVEIEVVNPRKQEALCHTDYVLTLSKFAADSMRRNGWPESRLFTVNLGVDLQAFRPKEKYSVAGPLHLLFVGTIMRRKGIAQLLQAVQNLPRNTVRLTLIGPIGDAADLLKKYAGSFQYFPFQHHEMLVHFYQQADIFVFPSLLDSWGQTVLEAMACGTPAIVTENTGAQDAVWQGGGWVIPANEVTSLQSALEFCLENRNNLERQGILARKVAEQYSWENYHRQVVEVLGKIAQREQIPLNPV